GGGIDLGAVGALSDIVDGGDDIEVLGSIGQSDVGEGVGGGTALGGIGTTRCRGAFDIVGGGSGGGVPGEAHLRVPRDGFEIGGNGWNLGRAASIGIEEDSAHDHGWSAGGADETEFDQHM